MNPEQQALLNVLAVSPDNHDVRILLVRSLLDHRDAEALEHCLTLNATGQLPEAERETAIDLALDKRQVDIARQLLTPPSQSQPSAAQTPTTDPSADVSTPVDDGPKDKHPVKELPTDAEPSTYISGTESTVSFSDIGGLDDVKKAIERLLILPLQRPDLYQKYGKKAGGGVLLYGPPGCGKTMVAKAVSYELGLPFYNVRIEDIVDPYFGVSEKRLVEVFTAVRELQPCALFIDEFDSLGYARSKQGSERSRALVEVLLQQLDSIGTDNSGILVLAASNEPWDIDGALVRPGRFDRSIFVPPPDKPARSTIIERRLTTVPHRLDLDVLTNRTPLFSGADLLELIERSLEPVIDHAIQTGQERPLEQSDIETALADSRATTISWLLRARNHTDFSNSGGRWDDVEAYLKRREVAKLLR